MGEGEFDPRGCGHQACSESTYEGIWKCWPCILYSPSTGGASAREWREWWSNPVSVSSRAHPVHVVVVRFLGFDPFQDGLILMSYTQ